MGICWFLRGGNRGERAVEKLGRCLPHPLGEPAALSPGWGPDALGQVLEAEEGAWGQR